eukprot:COSAG01_NODE_2667_length_7280_cov_384.625400_3_plen_99_part_00
MFRVPDVEREKQRDDYFADDVKKEDRICGGHMTIRSSTDKGYAEGSNRKYITGFKLATESNVLVRAPAHWCRKVALSLVWPDRCVGLRVRSRSTRIDA